LRHVARVGPFFLALLLWIAAFAASGSIAAGPNGTRMGGDFAIFMGGATVLEHGGNPYNRMALYRTETAMLRRQHLAAPRLDSFIRVANPPLLFWSLEPLVGHPFSEVAWAWIALMEILLAAGFLILLFVLGWTRRALPLLIFLVMPQAILAAYYGNVDAVVFAAVAAGIAVVRRYPFLAGCIWALAWLKPQIGLPAVGLSLLFLTSQRRPALSGFLAATGAGLVATATVTGWQSVIWWLGALTSYSRQIAVQPDIASLTGLYVYWLPGRIASLLQLLTLAAAALATGAWWLRRTRGAVVQPIDIAWLWILWFLATPFAHFHDQVLLALPLLALLGRNARGLTHRVPLLALYLMLGALVLFPTSRFHTDLQSLALIPILAGAIWLGLQREPPSTNSAVQPAGSWSLDHAEGRALAQRS
jgi:hypothetical protein